MSIKWPAATDQQEVDQELEWLNGTVGAEVPWGSTPVPSGPEGKS
jgi:hypothetical protein